MFKTDRYGLQCRENQTDINESELNTHQSSKQLPLSFQGHLLNETPKGLQTKKHLSSVIFISCL